VRLTVLLLAIAASAGAQSTETPAGLEPSWDIAVVLEEIGANAERLLTMLDRLDTPSWVLKGASETFTAQLESSKQQMRAVAGETAALARNPDKLSAALQLFFRMQGLETMIHSLEGGAQKYQSSQVAQALASMYGEGGANRERLRGYIVSLAAQRERQFEVMDREAQRCRGTLVAPAPPPKTPGRKK
jgi:hypothetical protein